MRVTSFVLGLLLGLGGVILCLALLGNIYKEQDNSGYYGLLFLMPVVVLGIILIQNSRRKNWDYRQPKANKIEHSGQLNDFLSFYIQTRVNGILKYETVIQYLESKYEIINLETQETITVEFYPGMDELSLESEIKTYVERLIDPDGWAGRKSF